MFASLLHRPRQARHRVAGSKLAYLHRRATADFTEADDDDDDDDDYDDDERHNDNDNAREEGMVQNEQGTKDNAAKSPREGSRFRQCGRFGGQQSGRNDSDSDGDSDREIDKGRDMAQDRAALHGEDAGDGDRDRGRGSLPVVPLFSASHLDSLPIYDLTHAIRIIICARTETTLSWDQLRSPQVSQFLVKPMQHQIRNQHFSRATLYALMANCLQFSKEAQLYAANAGNSNTRAKVCELLALKMLKEYTTRELIDALAYDFYPLQGFSGPSLASAGTLGTKAAKTMTMIGSRTSTLEVAIRASAKHFLAHPVVVQQLEAIWNGAITFISSADSLHRDEHVSGSSQGSSSSTVKVDSRTPLLGSQSSRQRQLDAVPGRRAAMLYDPKQASILKLSRLRVPRYRSFLSTLSLTVLIGLFLAVLSRRSTQISGLELVFWFWSAGFMLDELVGFNEQGFALYMMSFWNMFDLGILFLLIVYYCMRLYGVFMADLNHWNDMAYDVLAANAILLLPRVFSVLDHYQYFSQLLIALRLMVVDLVAIFVLIFILCSGFYVFFTLSNNENDGAEVAYKIFQIVMGYTPAAWDVWPTYNWLGRSLMVLFLIICHFLVVTILITVLTNSFTAIASNANEEHQFLFAVNTIFMVKNDSLFSYIAPSNIFAWLLMPLRHCVPLKHFVQLNRIIIKVTHFPVLFFIYIYERFWLAPCMFEPTDLVEYPDGGRERRLPFSDPSLRAAMFGPSVRVKEGSVAGFHKDQALEEVFRFAPETIGIRTQRRNERRKTQTAIRNWMNQHEADASSTGNWPTLENRAMPDWRRRLSVGWDRSSNLRRVSDVRSTASDPADLASNIDLDKRPIYRRPDKSNSNPVMSDYKDQTDADGDDELLTNDETEDDNATYDARSQKDDGETTGGDDCYTTPMTSRVDYFATPMTARVGKPASSQESSVDPVISCTGLAKRTGLHSRALSTTTILFKPDEPTRTVSHSSSSGSHSKGNLALSAGQRGNRDRDSGDKTPRRHSSPRRPSPHSTLYMPNPGSRTVLPPRGIEDTGGVSRSALLSIEPRNRPRGSRRLSSADVSLLSDNVGMPFVTDGNQAGVAGSFQTQMAMAMMHDSQLRGAASGDSADRMGRLVLARMKTLEESFAELMREMREIKETSSLASRPGTRPGSSKGSVEFAALDSSRRDSRKARGDTTPKKATSKRPNSRKSASAREYKPEPFTLSSPQDRDKGKGLAKYSTDDEFESR